MGRFDSSAPLVCERLADKCRVSSRFVTDRWEDVHECLSFLSQHHHHHPFHSLPDLNVALELTNQSHQKDFEVIMDALRIGAAAAAAGSSMVGAGATGCGSTTGNIDSCGQAAMMMAGEAGSVFHNLVVTSLET